MSKPLSGFEPLDLENPPLRRQPQRPGTTASSKWVSTTDDKNVVSLAKIANWIEEFVKLRPKVGPIRTMRFNRIQEILLQYVAWCWLVRIPVRVVTPKSRQLGSSSFWEALFYALCELVPGYRAAVIAHTDDGATELFDKLTVIKKHLRKSEWGMSQLVNDQGAFLQWDSESALWCGTIKTGDALGKGGSLSAIHFSEVANFSDKKLDASKAIAAIVNSMAVSPRMFEVYESTAKGHDPVFEPLCESARNQNSGEAIQLIFLPWFLDPEYAMSWEDFRRGLVLTGKADPGETFVPTEEESKLRERLKTQVVEKHEQLYRYCVELTDEQLIWRRWALANKCKSDEALLNQYYPSFYEECFTASSTSAFSTETVSYYKAMAKDPMARGELTNLHNKVIFEPSSIGRIEIFSFPHKGAEYVLAADVGGTTPRSDPHCTYVFDKHSREQVACAYGKWEEDDYIRLLFDLGHYFNWALSVVENNHSPVVAKGLFKLAYPNLYCYFVEERHGIAPGKVPGWNTNKRTKPQLSEVIRRLTRTQQAQIYDKRFWKEMPTFVWVPFPSATNPEMEGEYKAQGANHDDAIMAAAIGLFHCVQPEGEPEVKNVDSPTLGTNRGYQFYLAMKAKARHTGGGNNHL